MDVTTSEVRDDFVEKVNIGNHKKVSTGPSPDEHKHSENNVDITGENLSKDDQLTDGNVTDVRPAEDKTSFDNTVSAQSTKQSDSDAPLNDTMETDTIGNKDLELTMAKDMASSPERLKDNIENGSDSTERDESKQVTNSSSSLSITGIVQRNLGSASDPSVNVKESIYNFDDEEEDQPAPPSAILPTLSAKESKFNPSKATHPNHEHSSPKRITDNSTAAYSSNTKSKHKQNPGIVYVAKKSRPILANEAKRAMQSSTKKPKKKRATKIPKSTTNDEPVVVEKVDTRILSLDTSKDLYKEGYLVWGKIRGFSYWPGIITVDPMDGLTVKFMKANSDIPYSHVHFLGYERSQRAWLPETNIMEFKGIEDFDMMASKIPASSARKKDFTPKKTLLERFEKGADTAESVLPLSFKQRLEKLDLIYVLIPSLKEKEQPKIVEKQEEVKIAKGVKRKRKSAEDDSEKSATPDKKKRRKKDNDQSGPSMLNPAQKMPNMEISSQKNEESDLTSENKRMEVPSKSKKAKQKEVLSKPEKKIKKIKLVTNGNKIKLQEDEILKGTVKRGRPVKRGRKKHNIQKQKSNSNIVQNEKKIKEIEKRKNIKSDPPVTPKTTIDLPSGSHDDGDTEECGMGVTVRVSSRLEDTSETEIKDISVSSRADDLESDLEEPLSTTIGLENLNDAVEFKQDSHGKGAMLPKLGSLVWGRLPGFPYWPCFVTKCPDTGEYRRLYEGYKRCDYHVQFFNWNNESGWVRKTKPWCTIEEFQAMAKSATKGMLPTCTEYKAWRPTGKLLQKWTDAFNHAHSTSGMTRRERHDRHIVFYRSKMEQSKLAVLYTEGPHAKKRRKSSSVESHSSEITPNGGVIVEISLPAKTKPLPADTKQEIKKTKQPPKRSPGFRKPCPKSVQNKIKNSQRLNPKTNGQKVSSLQASWEPQLPPGWSSKVINPERNRISREYKSPEGIVFSSLKEATAYLFHQNCLQILARQTKNKLRSTTAEGSCSSLTSIPSRRRSYSFDETFFLPHRIKSRNIKNTPADDNNGLLGCDFGWFLICSDEMHYGVPKRGMSELEYTVGNLETGSIEYLKDLSLPSSWSIKKTWKHGDTKCRSKYNTETSIEYICKEEVGGKETQNFKSKLDVVQFLDGIGHPAIQLEQMLKNFIKHDTEQKSISSTPVCSKDDNSVTESLKEEEKEYKNVENDHEEDPEPPKYILSSINLCEWSVDQARRHPILGRAVTPCFVDMVQLPGIFLQHPSVIVEESENEMVISDYFTKEFIAKKIIYD